MRTSPLDETTTGAVLAIGALVVTAPDVEAVTTEPPDMSERARNAPVDVATRADAPARLAGD